MIKILTYGTYEIFHFGHLELLRRAKALGDYLIVGLSTDEFNIEKGKEFFHTFEQRKAILEACKYVDSVIPETCWEQKEQDIREHNISILVMGSDWQGEFDHLIEYCEVKYLSYTFGISTRFIVKKIRGEK